MLVPQLQFLADAPATGLLVYAMCIDQILDPHAGAHIPVPLDQIPQACIGATIATEDASFYTNPGVNFEGLGRDDAHEAGQGQDGEAGDDEDGGGEKHIPGGRFGYSPDGSIFNGDHSGGMKQAGIAAPLRRGPQDQIVLSSRVRLARNLEGCPFPGTARKEQRHGSQLMHHENHGCGSAALCHLLNS